MSHSSLDYKTAGVDIDAGMALVEAIKPAVAKTKRPEVLGGLGGFAGLFALSKDRYQEPVLVSSTDGVGTKLKVALSLNQHQNIGIDLVAMCVNDILVVGAEPLFFLDYYATAKLDVGIASSVINSIAAGCLEAGVALIGGETAEMPGMYQEGDYDIAGFTVGIVEKQKIIDGRNIKPGDCLIGITSSGLHANGFSLVRKIISTHHINLNTHFEDSTLGETLLAPTRIYVKTIRRLLENVNILGLSHITGGGLLDNLPRILPSETKAVIEMYRWPRPAIFQWLQKQGNITEHEMLRTFNCGIGMVICVRAEEQVQTLKLLEQLGEQAFLIGKIEKNDRSEPYVMAV